MIVLDHKTLREETQQQIDAMRCESRQEGAFVHACMTIVNNRRLAPCDSNRRMLESLLNPGEEPSAKLYVMLAEQFPTKFTWEALKAQPTKEEQRAAFDRYIRENNLSVCDANFRLFTQGAELENFARASQAEETAYAQEAARDRQRYLIHASPSQLKAEAAHEFATEHEKAVREDAERRHRLVLSQQQHYPALPASVNGEVVDAHFLRRISTTNYPLFKQLVKKYGSGNVTSRLRGENSENQ